MRVRYSQRAARDSAQIIGYLNERSPKSAAAVRRVITASIAVLADFPFIAPSTELPDVREMTIVRYPYKVYYTVREEEVLILHIRDSRRESWIQSVTPP